MSGTQGVTGRGQPGGLRQRSSGARLVSPHSPLSWEHGKRAGGGHGKCCTLDSELPGRLTEFDLKLVKTDLRASTWTSHGQRDTSRA